MQTIEFQAMGCHMMVAMDSDSVVALQEVPVWFSEWELMFSRFLSASELSRLNSRAGKLVKVSGDFWAVANLAIHAEKFTNGLVSPMVLLAINAAGYDRSFDCLSELGSSESADRQALSQTNVSLVDGLVFNSASKSILLKNGVQLDLGGFVKGWCADQVVNRLGQYASVLVDAGGDIAMNSLKNHVDPWLIGIVNPFFPDEDVCVVQVVQGGVATSGRDYRHWLKNGEKQHHIIDPRTSRPAVTDVMSATVLGSSASEAEIAAKVVMILGVDEGLNWIHQHPQFSACVIDEHQHVHMSKNFETFLVS